MAEESKPETLPSEVEIILDSVPKDKRTIVLKQIQTLMTVKTHRGPLPDAESLRIYNDFIPDGGDRLMKEVEKQSDHRILMEQLVVKRQFNQSSIGQIFALIIALFALTIAWDLAKNDKQVVGGIIGGATVLGLVATFIVGRKKQTREIQEKRN